MSSTEQTTDIDSLIFSQIQKAENNDKKFQFPKYFYIILFGFVVVGVYWYDRYISETQQCQEISYVLSGLGNLETTILGEKDLENPNNEYGKRQIILTPVVDEDSLDIAIVGQERLTTQQLNIGLDQSQTEKKLRVHNRAENHGTGRDTEIFWDPNPSNLPIVFSFECTSQTTNENLFLSAGDQNSMITARILAQATLKIMSIHR
jgi:hypothetical protein